MSKENNKVNFNYFINIIKYVLSYKFILIIGILCMLVSSYIRVMSTVFIKTIIDDYIVPMVGDASLYEGFKTIMLEFFLVCVVVNTIALYTYSIIFTVIESKLVEKMRNELFNKMMRLPLSFFDGRAKGDVMSLYTNDIDTFRFIISECLSTMFCSFVSVIGVITVMFYYNFKLTILMTCILVIMVILTKIISTISRKLFSEQQKGIGAINGFIEEMVNGLSVVKVFCREKQTLAEFDSYNQKLYNISNSANTYSNILMPSMVSLGNVGYILILIFGSILAINGNMSLGVILALLRYTKVFVNFVSELSEQFPNLLKAIAAVGRLSTVLDMDVELDDGEVAISNGKITKGDQTTDFHGNVKFENVYFSYKDNESVLKNVSFDINNGQKIAFVGSTGAGKTTITNLLMRFYDINSGNITIDGVDINNIKKKDLRRLTSVVLQDVHMFNGSIIDNIKYGKLDIDDEEVMRISELTKIDRFVKHLRDGYKTNLKSDAGNLSQGEKQLLAITRAVAADRPMLIFDEATSSVDTRTEKLINDVLDTLFKDKLVFVIAHRLSTIRNADKIVVLENGEVIEFGDHEELLRNRGRYYQLCCGKIELD